jgi:hypothetical protein
MRGFEGQKYLSLETYRRNGVGVRTPVWFAEADKIYVYSTADSGKAKRIRRNSAARIAPCDARGNVTGDWIDVVAEFVSGAEYAMAMRLLDRKYFPWKQLLNFSAMLFRRRERVVIAIRQRQ